MSTAKGLRAGQSGVRILAGATDFYLLQTVQTGPGGKAAGV
jgi:hypothetical protein